MIDSEVVDIIICAHCGTRNRVKGHNKTLRPVCGRCGSSLEPPLMQIGDYFLGQNISNDSHLTEVSKSEYKALPKVFHGEKILRASDVTFLGHSWNILLGTTKGRVYKLSAQFISDDHNMVDRVYSEAINYCSKQYGSPSSGKNLPYFLGNLYETSGCTEQEVESVMMWKSSQGNVILDHRSLVGDHFVNLQATSEAVAKESRPMFPYREPVGTFSKVLTYYSTLTVGMVFAGGISASLWLFSPALAIVFFLAFVVWWLYSGWKRATAAFTFLVWQSVILLQALWRVLFRRD
jgi:hypothetical protein